MATDLELIQLYQSLGTTNESIEVVIGGISDLRGRIMYCSTDRRIENEIGFGFIGIGRAYLVIDNTDSDLFADGKSKVAENADIRIWMGFNGTNLAVWAGVVRRVIPVMGREAVLVQCADKMMLMYDKYVGGSMGDDNTPKLIAEEFCGEVGAPATLGTDGSGAGVAGEIIEEYNTPTFDHMRMLSALQNVQNSIFHSAVFDEDGVLQMYQRDRSNPSTWTYDKGNVDQIEWMAESDIVNSVWIEYDERFFVLEQDQQSIDDNGEKTRRMRVLVCNSENVSERLHGTGVEEIDYSSQDKVAFKITSASGATSIDCLQLSLGQDGSASGDVTVQIYDDYSGTPNRLLGTSQVFKSAGLWVDLFVWESFYFKEPVSISASRNYWVAIDVTAVSAGVIYLRVSRGDATAEYAVYSGSWTTQNNKRPAHRVKSSLMARRAASDMVRFFKDGKDICRIMSTYGVPQVSLFDDIGVDVSVATMGVAGRHVVERVEHFFGPDGWNTRHTTRALATGSALQAAQAKKKLTYDSGYEYFTLGSGKTLGDATLLGARWRSN